MYTPWVLAVSFTSSQGIVSENKDRILIDIEVDQILEENLYSSDADLYKHLNVYLEQSDQTKPILRKSTSSTDENSNQGYYWAEVSPSISSDSSVAGKYKITMSIEVQVTGNISGVETIEELATQDTSSPGVKYILEFLDKEGNVQLKETTTRNAVVVYGKPAVAPEGVGYEGIHKGIQLSWTANTKVNYSVDEGGSEIQFVPSQIVFYLFSQDSGPLDIQGKIVKLDTGEHEATGCRIEYLQDSTSCQLTCADAPEGSEIFLDETQSNSAITTKVLSNTTSGSGQGKVIGLEPSKKYIVFAQYLGGQKRSDCQVVNTIQTVSLTEINGDEEGKEIDPRCFIATAAWGSSLGTEIDALRWFRDKVLLQLPFGRFFVDLYYTVSPSFALWLNHHQHYKSFVRMALWPLVYLSLTLQELTGITGIDPQLFFYVVMLVLLLLSMRQYWARFVRYSLKVKITSEDSSR